MTGLQLEQLIKEFHQARKISQAIEMEEANQFDPGIDTLWQFSIPHLQSPCLFSAQGYSCHGECGAQEQRTVG